MKTDLKDVTFLILIRLDSIQRLENVLVVTNTICKYFDTNIFVLEAAGFNNMILKSLLNKKILYRFFEDKDPILYKTKYFNMMVQNVDTRFIAIWDSDIVIDKNAIEDAIHHLRVDKADVSFPYNGECFEISEIIRNLYLKNNDIRILHRNKGKMDLLYEQPLVGGAVLVNRKKYIFAGMENEKYYGWGNDDFDRYWRFKGLDYKIHRTNTCLFHLSHPRYINSQYRSKEHMKISDNEVYKSKGF